MPNDNLNPTETSENQVFPEKPTLKKESGFANFLQKIKLNKIGKINREKAVKNNFFVNLFQKKANTINTPVLENKKEEEKGLSSYQAKPETENSGKALLSKLFQKVKEEDKKAEKNLFVELFPSEKKEESKTQDSSLIETIVEQSENKQTILGQELKEKIDAQNEKKEIITTDDDKLFWSKIGLSISIIIPLILYLFLYFQLATDSKILALLGINNNLGIEYQTRQQKLDELNARLQEIENERTALSDSLQNSPVKLTINQIRKESVDWVMMLDKINEVTDGVVDYNNILKRLTYSSYAFTVQGNQITLAAKLFDPNNSVFALNKSFFEAMNNSEYFQGLETRSFSKTILEDGGAEMSLSLNFNYIPESFQATPETESGSVLN